MAKQWRCAVVGTGVVGEWHVQAIRELPNAELAAVCNRTPEKARRMLAKHGLGHVPVFKTPNQMLKKEQVDVVHVCTPSGDHMKPALAAMKAGANVICEKPLEIKLSRIDKMIETADRYGVKLAGMFQRRWDEANLAVRRAAEQGRFGTIAWGGSFTPWHRTDEYYASGGWRGTWKWDGGGAIMNQSIHAVDLLQWIVGPVRRVSAYAANRIHGEVIEVEDTLSCSVEFESGALGTIMGSTAMYPGARPRIEVGGENGHAVVEGGLAAYAFRDERESDRELVERVNASADATSGGGASATDVGLDAHRKSIESTLRAWDEGREAETSGAEARKAVAIILAMYKSARRGGRPVAVE